MSTKPIIVELDMDQLEDLLQRAEAKQLHDEDYATIKALAESYVHFVQLVGTKNASIARLRKLLFGATTEKTAAVIGDTPDAASSLAATADPASSPSGEPAQAAAPPRRPAGHGRNGAEAYTAAETIAVPHGSLQPGDPCPECGRGTVYDLRRPGVLVRITGQAPVAAKVYRLQKLRCHLCGKIFTADAPEGVGPEKYDASVRSMIGLLKYGSGMPFNRQEGLQGALGVPLPASTQWDLVCQQAERLQPAYDVLVWHAAQGEVVHNDDTTARILEWMGQRGRQRRLAEAAADAGKKGKASQRSGLFTSGIVSQGDGHRIALFFTGRQHAGENLQEVLLRRAEALGPPIQMCDALSRNLPGELKTILANCLAHGRRQFVEVTEQFPEACRHVLESLAVVYQNDAITRDRGLPAQERLEWHQAESGPTMAELKGWLSRQFDDRLVEPNSTLGGAITYLLRHWEKLTLFLRVPGAPLDNNICERALKKSILHRKNALFFKTEHGAHVGDLYMSLIHTCELSEVNPFDYLTELDRHADDVALTPERWLPWNYRQACPAPAVPAP
jgi:transposase